MRLIQWKRLIFVLSFLFQDGDDVQLPQALGNPTVCAPAE
jgi:hypothetical protein